MGRGISDLQRWILLLCLENGFLSTQEILSAWRDWKPAQWGTKKIAIGKSEYNSGHASLSRSLDRLWRRDLIIIWKSITHSATGISLTPQGQTLAQTLSDEETEDAING